MATYISVADLEKVEKIDDNKMWFLQNNKREIVIIYESEQVRDGFYDKFYNDLQELKNSFEFRMCVKRDGQIRECAELMRETIWNMFGVMEEKQLVRVYQTFVFACVSKQIWQSRYIKSKGKR